MVYRLQSSVSYTPLNLGVRDSLRIDPPEDPPNDVVQRNVVGQFKERAQPPNCCINTAESTSIQCSTILPSAIR